MGVVSGTPAPGGISRCQEATELLRSAEPFLWQRRMLKSGDRGEKNIPPPTPPPLIIGEERKKKIMLNIK